MAPATNALSLLFVLSIVTTGQMRFQPPPTPTSRLIRAGRILDVKSGTYLTDQGILTDGEKIKAIGPWEEIRARASTEAALIDLGQATLLPGLIDCHAHLLISRMRGPRYRERRAAKLRFST